MPQSAQADHPESGARADVEVSQWRVGGDARAQQWSGGIQSQRVGDTQDVVLVDDDAAAVAAVSRLSVLAHRVVSTGHPAAGAVLLQTGLAVLAGAAGVDEAADAHPVADCEFAYLRTDLGHDAGDLMSGHHRVAGLTPLGAHRMNIGVADPGEVDVESDVVWADAAAGDRGFGQRFGGRCGGVGGDGAGVWAHGQQTRQTGNLGGVRPRFATDEVSQ